MIRAAAETVMISLCLGVPVRLPSYDDAELFLEDNELVLKAEHIDGYTGESKEVLLRVPLSFNDFLKECAKLSMEDRLALNASNALARLNLRKKLGRDAEEKS